MELKEFVKSNKYLRDRKYYKGLRWASLVFPDKKGTCFLCKAGRGTHQLWHNRKTDGNRYIHRSNDYMCFDCAKAIDGLYIKS